MATTSIAPTKTRTISGKVTKIVDNPASVLIECANGQTIFLLQAADITRLGLTISNFTIERAVTLTVNVPATMLNSVASITLN